MKRKGTILLRLGPGDAGTFEMPVEFEGMGLDLTVFDTEGVSHKFRFRELGQWEGGVPGTLLLAGIETPAQKCECGRWKGPGQCPVCDNDE